LADPNPPSGTSLDRPATGKQNTKHGCGEHKLQPNHAKLAFGPISSAKARCYHQVRGNIFEQIGYQQENPGLRDSFLA
jgi:hypothetical protein